MKLYNKPILVDLLLLLFCFNFLIYSINSPLPCQWFLKCIVKGQKSMCLGQLFQTSITQNCQPWTRILTEIVIRANLSQSLSLIMLRKYLLNILWGPLKEQIEDDINYMAHLNENNPVYFKNKIQLSSGNK